ncbi:MAG: putative Ig domain-containing protein [Chloroflexota bacterium]|nr:putative Ig domain-containing protein [Chloroflexota bacterium]
MGGRRRASLPLALAGLVAVAAVWALATSPGLGTAAAQVSGPGEPEPSAAAPSVCERTPAIRDAIVAQFSGQACATITAAQLAAITSLGYRGITDATTALKAGDLAGLTGLTWLDLSGTDEWDPVQGEFIPQGRLRTLPKGVFDELTNLTQLRLFDNQLSALPAGVFDRLTKLTHLYFGDNQLTALPEGLFANLSSLTHMAFHSNRLTALPANLFAGLIRLRQLRITPNPFQSPPLVVHLVRDPLDGSVRAWMPAATPHWVTVSITATQATPASATVTVQQGQSVSEAVSFTPSAGAGSVSLSHTVASPWLTYWFAERALAAGDLLTRPRFGTRTVADQRLLVGRAIAPLPLPEAQGTGTLQYSLKGADGGALPEGLSFDAETRRLTGAPTAGGEYELLYRVADPRLEGMPEGDAQLRFTVRVVYPPPVFAGLVGEQRAQVGEAFSLTLPEATGAAGGINYRLSALAPGALPDGLSFDPIARTLSGTPTGLAAVELDYEATDRVGNRVALRFRLITFSVTSVVVEPEPLAQPSVCDRTTDVREAILSALGVRDCAAITAAQLAGITELRFLRLSDTDNTGTVRSLQAGDFHGLSGLTRLDLSGHQLSALPQGVFAGLEGLTALRLDGNRLEALPDGLFLGLSGLQSLRLDGNAFSTSPLVVHLVEDVHDAGGRSVRGSMPVGAPAEVAVAVAATHATPESASLTVPASGDTGAWLILATSDASAAVRGVSAAFPTEFNYRGPPLVIAGARAAQANERRTLQEQCAAGVAVTAPADNTALVGDCATLLGLRDALRGDIPLNWSAAIPISSWEGITLAGTPQRVTEIELATLGLNGRLPSALSDLDALVKLDLTFNKLGGGIPAELGKLVNLTDLLLFRNALSGSIPPQLGRLANLQALSLSQNFLSGEIPPELGKVSKLQSLHLYQNRLSGAIPPELQQLEQLGALFLAENSFTGCIPFWLNLTANHDLGGLRLSECPLEFAEPETGVASVPVPSSIQIAMLNDRLASAQARRAALQALLDSADSNEGVSGAVGHETGALRAAIAEAEAEIARLQATDTSCLKDTHVEVPYTTSRFSFRGNGIAFSTFTYEDSEPQADCPVGIEFKHKDPTQFVLWDNAKHQYVRDAFEKHTRLDHTDDGDDLYRWQSDGDGCPGDGSQYMALRNSSSGTGGWVWVKSAGLQPVGEQCAGIAGSRHHFRFFSSDDTKINIHELKILPGVTIPLKKAPPVGPDPEFGHWTVMAAHVDGAAKLPDVISHTPVDDTWRIGKARVLDSIRTPVRRMILDPMGLPVGENFIHVDWVNVVRTQDFGNELDPEGKIPQGIRHDGIG